jgi:transposase InsO family protein
MTHFTTAKRVAFAVMDVVSRRWLRTLVTTEESATQVEVLFTGALDEEGLWERIEARRAEQPLDGDGPEIPILLAMSDNGPQMRAGSTREFLALCSIVAHFGRPGTPTDQAWIETLFGHVKGEWPHLDKIRDPAVLTAELELVRADYNGRRLHAGIGYVTPDDEHNGRGEAIRQARRDGLARARAERLAYHRYHNPETRP